MSEFFKAGALARWVALAPVAASGLLLSGCMSSPTYGTDKTANEQLMSDVSGMLSLGPRDRNRVEYTPRPELVRPEAKDLALPAPQPRLASAGNEAWPESPEEKRVRLRAQATDNSDDPSFEPSIINDISKSSGRRSAPGASPRRADDRHVEPEYVNPDAQRRIFQAKLAETRQGSVSKRKYLSEPPLVYRQPEASAPVEDLGEDESRKKRRRDAAAGVSPRWKDFVPGL